MVGVDSPIYALVQLLIHIVCVCVVCAHTKLETTISFHLVPYIANADCFIHSYARMMIVLL